MGTWGDAPKRVIVTAKVIYSDRVILLSETVYGRPAVLFVHEVVVRPAASPGRAEEKLGPRLRLPFSSRRLRVGRHVETG